MEDSSWKIVKGFQLSAMNYFRQKLYLGYLSEFSFEIGKFEEGIYVDVVIVNKPRSNYQGI